MCNHRQYYALKKYTSIDLCEFLKATACRMKKTDFIPGMRDAMHECACVSESGRRYEHMTDTIIYSSLTFGNKYERKKIVYERENPQSVETYEC